MCSVFLKPVGYLQVWTRIWTRRKPWTNPAIGQGGGRILNSVPPDCKPFGHADTYKKVVSEWFPLLIFPSYFLYFLCKNIFLRPIRTPSDILGAGDRFMRGFLCFGRRKITGPGYPSDNKISNLHYTNGFWRFLNIPSSLILNSRHPVRKSQLSAKWRDSFPFRETPSLCWCLWFRHPLKEFYLSSFDFGHFQGLIC